MHQNHIPAHHHQGQITPPHQIHNPTPAYHHPSFSTSALSSGNSSPPSSSFHHTAHHTGGVHQPLPNNEHALTHHTSLQHMPQHQSHHQLQHQPQHQRDSPAELEYGANQHSAQQQANMPPTPNSLLTMVGPNSGNSTNSNEPVTPNNEHTSTTATPNTNNTHGTSLAAMGETHSLLQSQANSSSISTNYSPWNTVVPRPLAQLSPTDHHPNGCAPQMAVHQPYHHHIASGLPALHHSSATAAMGNGGASVSASAYMHQQSLPNFGHSPAKGFSMTPQPYYWY